MLGDGGLSKEALRDSRAQGLEESTKIKWKLELSSGYIGD